MARLSEEQAVGLAREFIRQEVGWWRRRRIGRRPIVVDLIRRGDWGTDSPAQTQWMVVFPRRVPKDLYCDPDPSRVGVIVEDESGLCSWVMAL